MRIRKGDRLPFHLILVLKDPRENLSKSQVTNRQMQSLNEGVTKKNNTTQMNLKNRKELIHLLLVLMYTHLYLVLVKNSQVKRIKLLSLMNTHKLMMHRLKRTLSLIPRIKINKISAQL